MQNFTRRELICAGAMGCFLPTTAWAHKVKLPERFEPQLVNTRRGDWVKGDVHVVPDDFFLYFMLEDGMAIRYGVGVGRKGLYEPGEFTVARKAKWPWWRPTNAMIRREPRRRAKQPARGPRALSLRCRGTRYLSSHSWNERPGDNWVCRVEWMRAVDE